MFPCPERVHFRYTRACVHCFLHQFVRLGFEARILLQDNIIFGQLFEEIRYSAVVKACALWEDIAQLEAGDLTELGERGINLSGTMHAHPGYHLQNGSDHPLRLIYTSRYLPDIPNSKSYQVIVWCVELCMVVDDLRLKSIAIKQMNRSRNNKIMPIRTSTLAV